MVEEGQGRQKETVSSADVEEGLRANLVRLFNLLGAQRAARSRTEEGEAVACKKVEVLCAREGQEEREAWARANLEKAQQKVLEWKANLEHLERSVQRLEDWIGWGRKVMEEVVEEEVEEVGQENVGERVKEEVEENVVEKKVGGVVADRFFAPSCGGGHHGLALGPHRLG